MSEPRTSHLQTQLRDIVGRRFVLTNARATRPYAQGYRTGGGHCSAVVRPGTLVEMWRCVQACVDADAIVILQAANTGLTGGSTPSADYDRPVVVLNTMRMNAVIPLDNGRQAVCLPGATLTRLERALRALGREPHSIIGSSCIGASVIGGVCNNSGGALVQRGPAYTELALYARLSSDGRLELINHLGVDLGDKPEEMLRTLESGEPLNWQKAETRRAGDHDYGEHVRLVDADTPARFNADKRHLFEASGSAGKVAVFAVRLDTFEPAANTTTFYIGTNDPAQLTALRRAMLQSATPLPVAAEYLHRDGFELADDYGRDTYYAIRLLGAERMALLARLKRLLDSFGASVGLADASAKILQRLSKLLPPPLPRSIKTFGARFEHHLLLKVADSAIALARELVVKMFSRDGGEFIECSPEEAEAAFLHRFVTAGAAVRYRAVHPERVEDLLALDVALKRSERNWVNDLPSHLDAQCVKKIAYGHFFCHVFHRDYLVAKGNDAEQLKHDLCALLEAQGAEYPAEHNVGHLYAAKTALRQHYENLDPRNAFNPGVGKLSKLKNWRGVADAQHENIV